MSLEKLNRREALKNGGRMVLGAAAGLIWGPLSFGCSHEADAVAAGRALAAGITPIPIETLRITIVYDNIPYRRGLEVDWGFACLVEGLEQTILFDTGRYDTVLVKNMAQLGIEPRAAGIVFLSHAHPDHIGGLNQVLGRSPGPRVYAVRATPSSIGRKARASGARMVAVDAPVRVARSAMSSGEMKSFVMNEQSLFIATTAGVIVITGCAHPGVVNIVERAQQTLQRDVVLALGGFHLLRDTEAGVGQSVSHLQAMGVRHVAPTHCSGRVARDAFAKTYGRRYLECGLGRIITARDLSAAV